MMEALIDKLSRDSRLRRDEYVRLIQGLTPESRLYLQRKARESRELYYGRGVYLRGLIEHSSYCRRNCLYCGIRRDNLYAGRYRLSPKEIMRLVKKGYRRGYRTFVLQGGEDPGFSTEEMASAVYRIKSEYPEVAVTLSLGEKSYEDYRMLYDAGADRYLLRHETASKHLYEKLHPDSSFENRRRCLAQLKEIGYEVGSGFMVGLPGQSAEELVYDILYLKQLEPHMVGIGPFIPHSDTPLGVESQGSLESVLDMISIVRLSLPMTLIPSTTALGSVDPEGREKGLMAGANVLMPNLNEPEHKAKYTLYDGKICIDESFEQCGSCLKKRVEKTGYRIDMSRGNSYGWGMK